MIKKQVNTSSQMKKWRWTGSLGKESWDQFCIMSHFIFNHLKGCGSCGKIKKYRISKGRIKEACLKIVDCHVPNEKTLTKVYGVKEMLQELAMHIWSRELQNDKCLPAAYPKLQM